MHCQEHVGAVAQCMMLTHSHRSFRHAGLYKMQL